MKRLLFVAALCLATASCRNRSSFASVLLITVDTLRADHVSCYGSSPVPTPNLDGLARRGARFTRAWSPVPLTTPAHATILTGLQPPAHGVRNNARFRLPDEIETVAETAQRGGLRTAAFVSSFTTASVFGLSQGFERYDDDMGNDEIGERRNRRPANEVVDRSVAWLEANRHTGFFLWVHLYDPHAPYPAPTSFRERFADDPYSAAVAFADAQIGRLLKALAGSGIEERTVVVAVADHGEGLGTHGEDQHGLLLYEESLHVPLLVVAPGRIRPGAVIGTPAGLADIAPTLLVLLRLPQPPRIQGHDLLEPGTTQRVLYSETLYPREEFGWSPLFAVRVGDLKLLAGPTPELYDLAVDPLERRDLAGARPRDVERLGSRLREQATRLRNQEPTARGSGQEEVPRADTIERLESLGYVAGGAAGPADADQVVGGRSPREALGDYASLKKAQQLLREGIANDAVELLRDLRNRDPGNPHVLIRLAQARQRMGDLAGAEEALRDLLRRRPDSYLGAGFLSDLLEKQGRFEPARHVWLELKKRSPGYVGVEVRLAEIEIAGGHAEAAARRLEAYLAHHSRDADAWSQLGCARRIAGRGEEALEAFRRALEIHPTEAVAVRGTVELLSNTGRVEQAHALIRSLLERAPHDPLLQRLAGSPTGETAAPTPQGDEL